MSDYRKDLMNIYLKGINDDFNKYWKPHQIDEAHHLRLKWLKENIEQLLQIVDDELEEFNREYVKRELEFMEEADRINEEAIMDMEERLTICRCRNCNKELKEGIIYNGTCFCDIHCIGQYATCGEYN